LPDEEFDEDAPSFVRRRPPRRDCEPDRGSVVLTLGIISLVCMVLCILSPIGLILGLTSWVMGQKDLRKMRRGDMDPRGEGTTQAGWICGIIGTILNTLMTLGCSAYFGFIFFVVSTVKPPTPPGRPVIMPPPPAKAPQQWQPKPKAQPGPDW
jgi:hypothetical protein